MSGRISDKKIIETIISTNGALYLAAKKLECSPQTIYNRMAKNPKIKAIVEDHRGETVDIAEQKLRQAILNGEPWAIALELKTIGKTRGYVEKQEVVNSGEQTILVEYVNPITTTDTPQEPDTHSSG